MPRQIIDTESSRPAYVRRRVTTFVVTAVVVALLALVVWVVWSHGGAVHPGNSVR
ncbi:MAG TPA: hypothetical protein VMF61_16345 [Candidatus Acidoferrales bacterium]|nr:hypothetical protein [Candidatus Acidoferrales bacterium]